ncbi:MAG TPA: serine hydrolase, partial [Bacteroidales bacterium]|nr:serine hydrolase [Bacteroidales bacterium]
THDFSAMGFLGQFIYISPEKKLIIVRLGKDEGKISFWKFLVALSKQF